jgi:hypothetical protein
MGETAGQRKAADGVLKVVKLDEVDAFRRFSRAHDFPATD